MKIVKARLVSQRNEELEVTNITLTTEPVVMTDLADFKVDSGSWADSKVEDGEIVIVGPQEVIDRILNQEFRTVWPIDREAVAP